MLTFRDDSVLEIEADYIVVDLPVGWRADPVAGLDRLVAERWPDARNGLLEHVRASRFDGGDICAVPPTASRPGVIYLASCPAPDRPTMAFISRGIRNLVGWCRRQKVSRVALPLMTANTSPEAVRRARDFYQEELGRVRTEYVVGL